MMTYDEFFAEAKRLKCRMLPDDPADVRAIIDAKDAKIESLQEQLRTYGDQRAAEAREQMREECVKELQGMTTNNATARSAIKQCAEALKELK